MPKRNSHATSGVKDEHTDPKEKLLKRTEMPGGRSTWVQRTSVLSRIRMVLKLEE